MTDSNDVTTPSGNLQTESKAAYEVGYGKPPAAHRFKHGNRANPRGRRKGTRNQKVIVREVLFEAVTVREGETIRQMPALEAVLKKVLSKALGGDGKAAITIIGIAQKDGLLTSEQEQAVDNLSEADQAIMEDVKRRLGDASLSPPPEVGTNGGVA